MERLTKKIDSCTVFPEELVGVTLVPDNPIMCKILLRLAAYEDTGYTPSDIHAMRNELCQYCGKYKKAHEGACDGCRWREK